MINAKTMNGFIDIFLIAGGECLTPILIGKSRLIKNAVAKRSAIVVKTFKFLRNKIKLSPDKTTNLMWEIFDFKKIFKDKTPFTNTR